MSRWNRFEAARANFYSLAMYSDNFDDQLPPGKQGMIYTILLHSEKQKTNLKKEALDIITKAGVVVNPEMAHLVSVISSFEGEKVIDIVKKIVDRFDQDKDKESKSRMLVSNFENRIDEYIDDGKSTSEIELTKESYDKFFNGTRDKTIDDVGEEINADIKILQELLNETVVNAICLEKPFLALETQTMNNIKRKVTRGEEFRTLVSSNIHKICENEYLTFKSNARKQMAYREMTNEIKEILDSIKNENTNM